MTGVVELHKGTLVALDDSEVYIVDRRLLSCLESANPVNRTQKELASDLLSRSASKFVADEEASLDRKLYRSKAGHPVSTA